MRQTFAQVITEEARGEDIEAVVIGEFGSGYSEDDPRAQKAKAVQGMLLTWQQAAPLLDYNWHSGFGGTDCHPIYAWTATKVISIHEYDGSTSVQSLPRHPIACDPQF